MSGSSRPNGVVLCVIAELGAQGLAALPRASSVLEKFASTPIARAGGSADGLDLGVDHEEIDAALDELTETLHLPQAPALEDVVYQAESQRGTFTDFVTEKEKPRCCIHLIAHIAADATRNRHLYELAEALTSMDLAYAVHAIVGERGERERKVQDALEQLEYRFGEVGKLATLIGSEHALGAELDWEKALVAFQAIVRCHAGDTAEKFSYALEAAYGNERFDATIEPTRIGGYEGVSGSLRAELPAESPAWEWHGQDVGIVWVPRGADATRLVSLLLGQGAPPEIAEQIAIQGRAVFAFEQAHLASLVPIGGFGLRALVDVGPSAAGLVESLSAGGKKCREVLDTALASEGISSGEFDFQLVKVSARAPEAVDAGIESLANAVLARGGAFVVVTGDAVRVAADQGSATTPAPGEGLSVFRLVHELLGVPILDAEAANRRARRRR